MVWQVRTTVNIQDGLLQQARELAARSRRQLGEVVDDALRLLFSRLDDTAKSPNATVELPTYGGSGLQPGVDLEDKDRLNATLDADAHPGDERAAG